MAIPVPPEVSRSGATIATMGKVFRSTPLVNPSASKSIRLRLRPVSAYRAGLRCHDLQLDP